MYFLFLFFNYKLNTYQKQWQEILKIVKQKFDFIHSFIALKYMTILQFVRIQRMLKYNVLSMFKKGVINIGNVKNIVTPPPQKKKYYKLISERNLREETKVMFLEDINTAKQHNMDLIQTC